MYIRILFFLTITLYFLGISTVFLPSHNRIKGHRLGCFLAGLASFLLIIIGSSLLIGATDNISLFNLENTFFKLELDKLNSFFIVILGLVGTITSIYAYSYGLSYKNDKLKILTAEYNLFLLTMCLVLVAYNALAFLVVWEFMAIASFLLVNHEQYNRVTWQAAYQYILMTNLGTAFIVGAFFLLSVNNFTSLDFSVFQENQLNSQNNSLIFFLSLIGFATKAGLVPLHVWLPKAHPVAPTHVSALMSAVMLKMAVYGFLRFILDFLGTPDFSWGIATLFLGLISALVGALYLQVETDIKKLLAYSSIEHLGIIFSAIGAGLIFSYDQNLYWASICYLAAIVHSFNHAIIKTTLFLVAGCIIHSTHTRNIEHMGGLLRFLPVTSKCALVASMSICALPFTAGFLGEWLLLIGLVKLPIIVHSHNIQLLIILSIIMFGLTSALALAGFVRFFAIIFLGKLRSNLIQKNLHESGKSMLLAISIPSIICLLSGFFSSSLLDFASNILPLKLELSPYFSLITLSSTSSFNPLILTIILVTLIGVLYYSLKTSPTKQVQEVWSCGIHPNQRMQYSATGFSEPIRRVFSFFLKPEQRFSYLLTNGHNKKMLFKTDIHYVITEKIYEPLQRLLVRIAGLLRRIQAGGVQLYISYVLITLIFVLLYGAR